MEVFSGGGLRYWPDDDGTCDVDDLSLEDSVLLNVVNDTVVFDGRKAHATEDFEGEMYSLAFYTSCDGSKINPDLCNQLRDLGLNPPENLVGEDFECALRQKLPEWTAVQRRRSRVAKPTAGVARRIRENTTRVQGRLVRPSSPRS